MKNTLRILSTLLILVTVKVSAQSYTPRIIDGTNTSSAEFPSFVTLLTSNGLCGGTLIDKQWVMTAAHCLTDNSDRLNVLLNDIFVQTNPKPFDNVAAISRDNLFSASNIVLHPNYAFPQNDIALIKLSRAVENITPVVLNDNANGILGQTGTIVGFGSTTRQQPYETVTNQTPQYTQKASVPIISDSYCTGTLICAGSNSGLYNADASSGDSGGPLYLKRNGIQTQVGIISSGYGCGVGNTGAYTDVSQFKSFISSHTNARFLSGNPLKNVTGIWYDPSKGTGTGFTFMHSESVFTVTFYGYSNIGNPQWLLSEVIATPVITENKVITVSMRSLKQPGRTFNQPFSPAPYSTWGNATLTFKNCNSATVTLNGQDGLVTFNLVRLQAPKDTSCL